MITVCAADPGFRSDASAAVVVRVDGNTLTLVGWLERRPQGAPLQPSAVCRDIAGLAKKFDCTAVWSDFFYSESMREELAKHSLGLELGPTGQAGKVEVWSTARTLIHEGRVRVPDVRALVAQLKQVRARPTSGGGLSIDQPRVKGSHGDLASAFALALWAANKSIGSTWECGYLGAPDLRHAPPAARRAIQNIGGSWDDDDEDAAPSARSIYL